MLNLGAQPVPTEVLKEWRQAWHTKTGHRRTRRDGLKKRKYSVDCVWFPSLHLKGLIPRRWLVGWSDGLITIKASRIAMS
jgi:hypothetical protein